MKLVSIIIPCYNYGFIIGETLDCLIAQSYQNWEAIIVDDGSQDNSREIIEDYARRDSRFRFIFKENAGVSVARNIGFKEAKGDFIQFLDADDLITPDKIQLQVAFLAEYQEVGISYTDHLYFQHDAPDVFYPDYEMEFRDWMPRLCDKGFNVLDKLLFTNIAVVSSPLLRREIVALSGGFPEFSKHTEDWEFWFRCAIQDAKFCYFDHPAAKTLIRIHNKSVSKDLRIMREGEIRFRDRIVRYVQSSPYLSEDEKGILLNKNKDRKRKLYKLMMYDLSLVNIKEMRQMAAVSDMKIFVSFYFKALNHRRKELFKNG